MKQIQVSLSAYGKLPLSKEYLRFQCFGAQASRYRAWVDEGHEHAVARGGKAAQLSGRIWRLLLFLDETASVATIRASSDGLRSFPFSCYSALEARSLPGPPSRNLARLLGLWTELEACNEEASRMADPSAFQELLGARTLSPIEAARPDAPDALDREPIELFCRALFGGEEGAEALPRFLWRLRQACAQLDRSRTPGVPALRLPLARGRDPGGQAMVWLRFLEANRWIPAAPVSLAYPAETREEGRLWVLSRPGRAEDLALLGTDAEGFLVPPPADGGTEALGFRRFRERVEAELLAGETTLGELAGFVAG
ncbi:MAG: hypothetical protein ACE5F1_01325 [Planctomycetota bacterium]